MMTLLLCCTTEFNLEHHYHSAVSTMQYQDPTFWRWLLCQMIYLLNLTWVAEQSELLNQNDHTERFKKDRQTILLCTYTTCVISDIMKDTYARNLAISGKSKRATDLGIVISNGKQMTPSDIGGTWSFSSFSNFIIWKKYHEEKLQVQPCEHFSPQTRSLFSQPEQR